MFMVMSGSAMVSEGIAATVCNVGMEQSMQLALLLSGLTMAMAHTPATVRLAQLLRLQLMPGVIGPSMLKGDKPAVALRAG